MPGVDHHRRRPPRREGRQHSVPGQEERRGTAPLENALDDLLAVAVGLRGGLGEHEGVLAGVEAEAVLEGVVPEGLDGVPVGVGAVGAEGGDDLFFFFFLSRWIFEIKPPAAPLLSIFELPANTRQLSLAHLHVVAAESTSVAPGEQGALLAAIAVVAGRRRFLAAL